MAQEKSRDGNREEQKAQEEFEKLYEEKYARWVAEDQGRADWAPKNPRRLFNLVMQTLYPDFKKQMTIWEFLAVLYDTLWGNTVRSPGLFRSFDPGKYQSDGPLEDHFSNMFKARMQVNLQRSLGPRSDSGRCKDLERYCGHRLVAEPGWRKRELVDSIPDMLGRLSSNERIIIHMIYWDDLSARKIAEKLGLDHKTVIKRHAAAIKNLRWYYEVEFGFVLPKEFQKKTKKNQD